jgi:hypothetical protein
MVGPMTEHTDTEHTDTEHTDQAAMHDGESEATAPSKTTASRRSNRAFARIPPDY